MDAGTRVTKEIILTITPDEADALLKFLDETFDTTSTVADELAEVLHRTIVELGASND